MAALAAAEAHGQTLNLGGPTESERPVLVLDGAARRLADDREALEAGSAGAVWRVAAEAALAKARADGEPAALVGVLGLTMADRAGALDRAAAEIEGDAAAAALARWSEGGAVDPALLLAAVRDAFAGVRPEAGRAGGWADAGGAWNDPMAGEPWAGWDVGEATRERLSLLGPRMAAWQRTRAHGRWARAVWADVADAGGLLSVRNRVAPPARLAPVRGAFEGELERLEAGVPGAEASRVARLASIGRLMASVRELDAGADARRLAPVLLGLAEAQEAGLDERMAEAERALSGARRVRSAADDRGLVRGLRPAHRLAAMSARAGVPALVRTAGRLVESPDALRDPGVLSQLNGFARRLEDLERASRASAVLASAEGGPAVRGGEPVVDARFRALSQQLVRMGRDMGDARVRDEAWAEWRATIDELVLAFASPAEAELRAALEGGAPAARAWTGLAGPDARGMLARFDEARESWLAARSAPPGENRPDASDALAVVRASARAMALLRDGVEFELVASAEGASIAAPLNAWPAWETPGEAARLLEGGLGATLRSAVSSLSAGDVRAASAALDTVERDSAAALLAGRLNRELREAGLRPGESGVEAALAELASGPPAARRGPGWRVREHAAWVSLLACERLALLSETAEAGRGLRLERAASMLRQANARASEALARLNASR